MPVARIAKIVEREHLLGQRHPDAGKKRYPANRKPRDRSAEAVAYNRGSDARLAGRPIHANPYGSATQQGLRAAWRSGWNDVQEFQGDRLPPVEGA